MKKTCFIIPSLSAGGIENYMLRFLNFLEDLSEFTVLVIDENNKDLYEEYKDTGVFLQFQRVGYFSIFKWIRLFLFFWEKKFNTVCVFQGNFSGIPITIAKMAGVENRVTFYRRSSNAFKETKLSLAYNRLINRLVYVNSTKILSNSQAALDYFFPDRDPRDFRFKVISNGIDTGSLLISESISEARNLFNIPIDSFVIGHIGRIDQAKNHDTIIKVASQLHNLHSNIIFVFCGRGTDSDSFMEKLRVNNIEKFSVCLGLQKNIPMVLKTMDLFYFPSLTEGQPNALLEAILSGLPVLTSDILPVKEILPEDLHSYLLPPNDVNSAVSVISGIICGDIEINKYIYLERIGNFFDEEKNFNDLINELK